ncbi:MAG TPA: DUF1553 domain-containing protein [Planctomycetaceae bacterium]|nr:DUF1553 domain-containing protein [Planctomycetaceae bacterium]
MSCRLGFAAWLLSLATAAAAADYAETVRATPGLLAYYRCEDTAKVVADASGQNHDAKLAGPNCETVDGLTPALGRGLRLAGGAHLRVPALGQHDAATVEMWLRLRKPAAEGLAGLYAADGWQRSFLHFNLVASSEVELAVNGAGRNPRSEPETVPIDRWIHLVTTYDHESGEQKLYRDGRLILDEVATPALPLKLVVASIGMWVNDKPTRPLEADVDEIAIYAAALTPGQVRQHYQLAKGISAMPVDFAKSIRPLLAERCVGCHGPEKQESELRLDVRDSAFRGGESGEPAIAPFATDQSHLLHLVTSSDREARMPPEGEPLTSAQFASLRDWIDQGAVWPDEFAGHLVEEPVTTSHWSFQPIGRPAPPVSDHSFARDGNAIDAFIFAKHREHGLTPSPAADRRTLIRRLYLDVHGLPPTPEEVERFVEDAKPQAWTRLVDDVLASPRYGERWASHWLDVIRYGDTHGFEVNTPRDNAWPYRDYVIKSLNDDKPYDQFLREQIAGDRLDAEAALGFLVAAPALLPGQVGKDVASQRQARSDELHEVIVSIGSGVLGLTVGCARCHNHKFDPISQRDYYEMQAILAGIRYGDRPLKAPESIRLTESTPTATAVFAANFTASPAVNRLYRGDPMQRRERVAPDIPAVFGSLNLETATPESDRRLALAKWLTAPDHPLTARVIANRLWQHHFGTGLVPTPSDFGAMGRPPSHPELLDHLASSLIDDGWSLKSLHRRILLSNTYRQASAPRADMVAKDASATFLWRYPPWRLEMEPIRDSILAVSGSLDLTMGGPGFLVFKPNTNYVRVYDPKDEWGPGDWRRMIYAHRVRMAQDGVFGAFDCPDAGQPAPLRSRSTTAIQALNLLNSTFVAQQAEILAKRARTEVGDDLPKQLGRVYALAYGRSPTDAELALTTSVANEFGLAAVCRAVFNNNEFLFVP